MSTVKWATFTVSLYLTVKLSPLLIPLVSEIGAWIIILTIAWKFSHFVTKNLLLRNFGRVESQGKAVLITGCDTGFGYQLALRLNELGYHVFAACLFDDNDGAKALRAQAANPRSMQVVRMDVTSDEDIARCEELITNVLTRERLTLHGLVNNAGIASPAAIEFNIDRSATDFQRIMDVNFLAHVRTCRTFLPFLRRSKGRIVNVASVSGRIPCLNMSRYSASKAAAISFSATLAQEVEQFGVKVCSVEPWFHRTPMVDAQSIRKSLISSADTSPEEVRDAYGSQFFARSINFIDFLLSSSVPSTEPVTEALVDALTSAEPDPVYHVMPMHIRALYFLHADLWPREISNLFVSALIRFAPKQQINNVADS
ncbi:D-beta-hydroxybutyrate dehydrogenase, mitochondrial [Halotydeus destructor]|nr:D-beta-hydroxybutyrate dehydrogenase, mitochondrial [Halotydeus destructor]